MIGCVAGAVIALGAVAGDLHTLLQKVAALHAKNMYRLYGQHRYTVSPHNQASVQLVLLHTEGVFSPDGDVIPSQIVANTMNAGRVLSCDSTAFLAATPQHLQASS